MHIAICDDDRDQINLTLGVIEKWKNERNRALEVFAFESAEEFLFEWSQGIDFDILFLDIKMKKMTGLELAKLIREKNDRMLIIFVTGFFDYVLNGYELQAFHYLVKPVKPSSYFLCLDRASKLIMQKQKETFIFMSHKQINRLRYDDILFFEIHSHYIELHSTTDVYTFKSKLEKIEQELQDERFFRCHRSYIVNLYYVSSIKKNELALDNGAIIPISSKRLDDMNDAFINYYTKRSKI